MINPIKCQVVQNALLKMRKIFLRKEKQRENWLGFYFLLFHTFNVTHVFVFFSLLSGWSIQKRDDQTKKKKKKKKKNHWIKTNKTSGWPVVPTGSPLLPNKHNTQPNPNKFTSSFPKVFPFTSLSHKHIIWESFIDQINPVVHKQLTNHFIQSQSPTIESPIISSKASYRSK